ncbi:hypothetical protein HAZT_HAZT012234 [Hyalella azteca]|uniref:Uncharacterized protein n=1 Tax=Hyalella azteca TaxID=294128 RepID=A0A6A0GVC9_HYAAZ|nr:hypothetical protein HAZT_HAZT012234 [Hyalella azteca]
MTKAVGVNFYTHLIKDEIEDNSTGRMDLQSPDHHIPSMSVGGILSAQSSSAPMDSMSLNNHAVTHNTQASNSAPAAMSIPPAHRRMDIDASLEPQSRTRSNTWPADYQEAEEAVDGVVTQDMGGRTPNAGAAEATGPPKKNTSRRNPWGNLSYADLIAQAISSSPESRATLSQVYEWMVNNIPYFKDKGDSNSSAGWKVSAL